MFALYRTTAVLSWEISVFFVLGLPTVFVACTNLNVKLGDIIWDGLLSGNPDTMSNTVKFVPAGGVQYTFAVLFTKVRLIEAK